MHDERQMPIKVLDGGTKTQTNPARVITQFNFPPPLPAIWLCLFRIEFGRDGSLYIKPTPDAGEYATSQAKMDEDGRIPFQYDKFTAVDKATADAHPYISFHARDGAINHPGRKKGAPFDQHLSFDLAQLDKYRTLCLQIIGHPGTYKPSKPPEKQDCVFDCFDGFPERSRVPIFTIDVAPYDGDPTPILEATGKDYDISYGYFLRARSEEDPARFLRVRLSFAPVEDGAVPPRDHHVVYAVQ